MRIANLQRIVEQGLSLGAKSIFLFPGFPPLGNTHEVVKISDASLKKEDVEEVLRETTSHWQYSRFQDDRELDYSFGFAGGYRFRINAFLRRGVPGLVLRPMPLAVQSLDVLGVPDSVKELVKENDGLVLISGPSGSGKSTTLAAMVDAVNRERSCHIVTIEDVIEYLYVPKRAIISQREVGRDTRSFSEALRRVLREDPDVIVASDIRDTEGMKTVLELADTGHLVFSMLHTGNTAQTLNRVVDFFPDHEKNQIRNQLARVLRAVVSQMLVQKAEGKGYRAAYEVFLNNMGAKNLIRQNKIHQVPSLLSSSGKEGMVTMEGALLDLYKKGHIDVLEVVRASSGDKEVARRVAMETAPGREELKTTRRFTGLSTEAILYCADCSLGHLAHFDASGLLLSAPGGLLFRASGPLREKWHFLVDYTIVNGTEEAFPLRSFFSVSYKMEEVITEKKAYYFKLRIVTSEKETIEIPDPFMRLVKDGNWHALAVPIPPNHRGKVVRSYMMLFDDGIREITFNHITFV